MIKVPTGCSFLGSPPFPAVRWSPFHCLFSVHADRKQSLVSPPPLIKTLALSDEGPTLMTSLNLIASWRPYLWIVTLGDRAFGYEFEGDTSRFLAGSFPQRAPSLVVDTGQVTAILPLWWKEKRNKELGPAGSRAPSGSGVGPEGVGWGYGQGQAVIPQGRTPWSNTE